MNIIAKEVTTSHMFNNFNPHYLNNPKRTQVLTDQIQKQQEQLVLRKNDPNNKAMMKKKKNPAQAHMPDEDDLISDESEEKEEELEPDYFIDREMKMDNEVIKAKAESGTQKHD